MVAASDSLCFVLAAGYPGACGCLLACFLWINLEIMARHIVLHKLLL